MNVHPHRRSVIAFSIACLFWCAGARAESPAKTYLDHLAQAVERTSGNIPQITASAQKAADRIIKGGHILVTGERVDFATEARGRAGGLMGLHLVGKSFTPKSGDVVLTSAVGPWTESQTAEMRRWASDGVQVVAFCPDIPAGLRGRVDVIKPVSDPAMKVAGGIAPADSTLNIVDLWVWTGEYVSACTRQGKMPVLYQSYGIPGARERAKKYAGKMFHDDFHIAPIPAGKLGKEYLDAIHGELTALAGETPKLTEAARWIGRAGRDKSCMVGIGHTFPEMYQDARAPRIFGSFLEWTALKSGKKSIPAGSSLVFDLSYQYPPDKLLEEAAAGKYKLIYCSVEEGKTKGSNILYFNPQWPLADACVPVKGYDIEILPPSGVIQAAIYWSIVASAR